MNFMYLLNHAIFAAFLSLIIIEVGISLLGLMDYKQYWERMKSYLMPMWEINGTFAVFYVVAFEAMYPKLLGIVGTVYIIPALVAALFFILRNAFLAYSEYIGDMKSEKRLITVYGASTIIVAILAISIFTSGVSGTGINVAVQNISVAFMANLFNVLAIISIVLISIFCAKVVFGFAKKPVIDMLFATLGIVIMIIAVFFGPSYMIYSLKSGTDIALFLFELVFLFVVVILHSSGRKLGRILIIPWVFSAVMAFSVFQYPYILGEEVNMVSYTTTGAIAGYVTFITLAGFAILAVSLGFLVYISSRQPVKVRRRTR